jgi:hypothetical protein
MKHIMFNNFNTLKEFLRCQGGVAFPASIISRQLDNIELIFLPEEELDIEMIIKNQNNYNKVEIDMEYLNGLKNIHRPFRTKAGEPQLFMLDEFSDKVYLIHKK